MNLVKLSTEALRMMHAGIWRALAADDATDGAKPYGVRIYPDWRDAARALETALADRGERVMRIPI